MQWTPEAEEVIKKVPFFVRKRVRARVEQEARQDNITIITPAQVQATQQRYLSGMASEIKGYQLDTCFGPSGCPNRIAVDDQFIGRIEQVLKDADLLAFLKSRVTGPLKFHHEFRVSLADCPNACSQPQIKDVGIMAACAPQMSPDLCSTCGACAETCRDSALTMVSDSSPPRLQAECCLACGQCIRLCPEGALGKGAIGYRVQLGGKLGRHPQLARELPGIYDADTVLQVLQTCLAVYKEKSQRGERFGEILTPSDFDRIIARFKNGSVIITPF